MGDLKVGEGFIDAVMIRVTATGAASLGLAPTCTLTRLSTGARVVLTVAEVSDGIYKVTDMVPGADDEYLTEWAVGGGNTIYQAYKLFKVGGGVIADWENGGRLDLLLDGVIADIGVFPTANYVAIAAYVEDIRARLIVILANVVDTKEGKLQVLEVPVTAALNGGVTPIATITAQPCLIESIVVHADTGAHPDMITCAVKGGGGQVIEFIGTEVAIEANLDTADMQVAWTGAVRLAATKTIIIDLQGSGANAADLTVTIAYRACVDGGYLT